MEKSFNPIFIGSSQIYLEEVDSTNKYLNNMLSKSSPAEGLVVFTDFQSSGRGQIGRVWESEKGQNLLMSVFLRPNFISIKDIFYLNIITSLAVRALVEEFVGREEGIFVKWPNDVYVDDKKIAGILIQNTFAGKHVADTVVGVGFNVNQKSFDLDTAISLRQIINKELDLNYVKSALFYFLEQYYLILKSGNTSNLINQYEQFLYKKGQKSRFKLLRNETVFEGVITGVDHSGKLKIITEGELKLFTFNEIKYL